MNNKLTAFTIIILLTTLSGCNVLSKLSKVGETPQLTEISNPHYQPDYQPISMPMPEPQALPKQNNSLWRKGSRAFFKDQRAQYIGDIVTVVININDSANLNNGTQVARAETNKSGITNLGGIETKLANVLPNAVNPAALLDTNTALSTNNKGSIERSEQVKLKVAAVIVQELPNGNLVLNGRQETRINSEIRQLALGGIIRPQDITSGNTIDADDIAELRLSYGGKGQISNVQEPRYGTQIVDIILPF